MLNIMNDKAKNILQIIWRIIRVIFRALLGIKKKEK